MYHMLWYLFPSIRGSSCPLTLSQSGKYNPRDSSLPIQPHRSAPRTRRLDFCIRPVPPFLYFCGTYKSPVSWDPKHVTWGTRRSDAAALPPSLLPQLDLQQHPCVPRRRLLPVLGVCGPTIPLRAVGTHPRGPFLKGVNCWVCIRNVHATCSNI